jgi:hypothetical protein
VRNIEERYNQYRENQKRKLNIKMNIEREKYAVSYEKHLQDVKQEAENLEAKTFKKYEGYVSIIKYN